MKRGLIFKALLAALMLPASSCVVARDIEPKAIASSIGDRQQIIALLQRVNGAEAEKDLGSYLMEGWPEAQFTVRAHGAPLSRADRRLWKEQIFSVGGIKQRLQMQRPRIQISGSKARVHVQGTGVDLYLGEDGEHSPAGAGFSETNDVVLEKRGSVWRVLSWDRVVDRRKSN